MQAGIHGASPNSPPLRSINDFTFLNSQYQCRQYTDKTPTDGGAGRSDKATDIGAGQSDKGKGKG